MKLEYEPRTKRAAIGYLIEAWLRRELDDLKGAIERAEEFLDEPGDVV